MKVLLTGGAGFIGSNLANSLISDSRVSLVRVLDNLSTGFKRNLSTIIESNKFEFIKGDIRDIAVCKAACKDIDLISHQAALGSVPRSIKDPLLSNNVNITGTLNLQVAAVENNVKRFVFAASSSTYGDSVGLPKVEDKIGKPLSPYAITKYVNELYAEIFSKSYDLDFIGLRYFNVFGPQQDPNGAYAAVIPIFFKAALNNVAPTINGDGSISRDFTYVTNAVKANILALFTENPNAVNQIYNVACGHKTSLTELWEIIKGLSATKTNAIYGPSRNGDIEHSLADISKIEEYLDYTVEEDITSGLQKAFQWYKEDFVTALTSE